MEHSQTLVAVSNHHAANGIGEQGSLKAYVQLQNKIANVHTTQDIRGDSLKDEAVCENFFGKA